MATNHKFTLLSFLLIISSIHADPYDDMTIAIRQSDYAQIKQLMATYSFSEHEKAAFHSLANEIVAERKTAIENRSFIVKASVLLKVTSPFTLFGGLIGFCMDPRGLGALYAIPSAVMAPALLAPLAAPFIERSKHAELVPLTLIGLAATAATYGLIKLEQYFWRRAKKIDQELQQSFEKAIDCKTLIVSLLSTNKVSTR